MTQSELTAATHIAFARIMNDIHLSADDLTDRERMLFQITFAAGAKWGAQRMATEAMDAIAKVNA